MRISKRPPHDRSFNRRDRTAFASTHEALGVACEEWDELRDAIRQNELGAVEHECLDLAAVLLRLARSLQNCETAARSVK